MSIVFITGGNQGLGHETARRLIELGHKVYIGCRNAERGAEAAASLGAQLVMIDVTDVASVSSAAQEIEKLEGHLDVLINNAGITGAYKPAEAITADEMRKVYETNVFGVVTVTNTFLPLLRKSENPVIVNVSSGMGSFGYVTDPSKEEAQIISLDYCSSKAAVSMLTLQYSHALKDVKVNCADPGGTATALNGFHGKQNVTEGTDAIVTLATIGPDGPTGTFINRCGTMPW